MHKAYDARRTTQDTMYKAHAAMLFWRGTAGSRRFARPVPPSVAPDPVLSLGLLVAQAGAAYRRWTGHPAPLATMSAAALHELSHAAD